MVFLVGGVGYSGVGIVDTYKEGQLEEARLEASRVGIRGYENSTTNTPSGPNTQNPSQVTVNLVVDNEKLASTFTTLPMPR